MLPKRESFATIADFPIRWTLLMRSSNGSGPRRPYASRREKGTPRGAPADQADRPRLLPGLPCSLYRRGVVLVEELPHNRPRHLGPRRPAPSAFVSARALEP